MSAETLQKQALVVDDVGFNRIILEKHLRDVEYEVDSVSSGEEAISRLSKKRYDIVISDLMMPSIDGIELHAKVQSSNWVDDQGAISAPPFILCTASTEKVRLEEALRAGFIDVILKPVSHDRLVEALAKAGGGDEKGSMQVELTGEAKALVRRLATRFESNPKAIVNSILEGIQLEAIGPDIDNPSKLKQFVLSSISQVP